MQSVCGFTAKNVPARLVLNPIKVALQKFLILKCVHFDDGFVGVLKMTR